MNSSIQKTLGFIVTLVLIGGMIFLRARLSYNTFDFQSSNFTFFWLSGRMLIEGENPYDEKQYLAGHETYGIKWQPNRIFPYPLPLAIFFIPLGFLSLPAAYITWQVITLLIVATTIFLLLAHWQESAQRLLLVPVFAAMFFFGPMYLTLHAGSVGAIALLALLAAILLLEKDKSLLAGIVLSLTVLKPPQGVPILFLAGIWFLARRDWKAIYGMVIGGIALLLIGMIQDPMWVVKFRGASEAVMDRTQGVHSNVWAFAYLACGGTSPCWTLLGAALSLFLLGAAGFFLWKNHPQGDAPAKWSAWEAFNLIIPISFVSTIYLWAYDQIPYLIPIVWIIGVLVEKSRNFIYAFLFLIVLVLYSLFALVQQAGTDKDLWSLGTTLIVLGSLWLASRMKQKPPIDKPSSTA
ncbi:MAG TPA: glycosyltransferase family 87 protein [Anaerolineales bacterium]|nr:glycosyltransferase family 87 protein [Anaerolineales bacterium]